MVSCAKMVTKIALLLRICYSFCTLLQNLQIHKSDITLRVRVCYVSYNTRFMLPSSDEVDTKPKRQSGSDVI